jgi:5-formyltetrahydrofolate cyclo-ligase
MMDMGAWRRENCVKKNNLRREIRGKIAAADPAFKSKASQIIEDLLLKSALWNDADAVFIFVSMAGREPDTLGLIKASLDSGKITAVPYIASGIASGITSGSRLMTFKGLNGEPFPASLHTEQHPFGFSQPGRDLPDRYPLDYAKPLIVVPGVAFTPQGVRLGNGGGFYDAFLGSLEMDFTSGSVPECSAVGICFSLQIVPEIPREPHDIGVQFVCTESGWFGTGWS